MLTQSGRPKIRSTGVTNACPTRSDSDAPAMSKRPGVIETRGVPADVSNRLMDTTSNRASGSTKGRPGVTFCACSAVSVARLIAPAARGTTNAATAAVASTSRFDSVRRNPIRLARIASMRALTSAPPTPATLMSGVST